MPEIHPTAIVHPSAELDTDVIIGPYASIGSDVKVGRGTRVQEHVVIQGKTTIGEENNIFPFSVLGTPPQDLKYRGTDTELIIGDRNTIREYVLAKTGTEDGGGITSIGNDCLIMANAHIAHDCRIGNHVILANFAGLAGHIEIQDHAVIGGMAGFHQFVRIGEGAMVGGGSMVVKDIPPFCIASGNRARLFGLNKVGLERAGTPDEENKALKRAYRTLFRGNLTLADACTEARKSAGDSVLVAKLIDFVESSSRGVIR